MSTLVVATLKSNSSSPPAFQNTSGTEVGTLCRAWVNFNGTGTVAIRGQFNVSSITDNGTGDYTVNFTNALADANYSTCISAGGSTGSWTELLPSTYSTSQVRMQTRGTTSNADNSTFCVSIFR
ncbi:MAG: hypothetical protein ACK5SP_01840 [bacterium]|jgi:hypothetical protein